MQTYFQFCIPFLAFRLAFLALFRQTAISLMNLCATVNSFLACVKTLLNYICITTSSSNTCIRELSHYNMTVDCYKRLFQVNECFLKVIFRVRFHAFHVYWWRWLHSILMVRLSWQDPPRSSTKYFSKYVLNICPLREMGLLPQAIPQHFYRLSRKNDNIVTFSCSKWTSRII